MRLLVKLPVAALVAAATIAACGTGDAEVVSERTTLGDAVMALYLNPQEQEFAAGINKGIVVLVDADGSAREAQTAGMDQGKVDFAGGELYYMDLKRGYFTGRTSTTIAPGATTDQIEGLLRVSDDYVGVYNEGGDPAGEYRYQVLHTTRTPPAARLGRVHGYFRARAFLHIPIAGCATPGHCTSPRCRRSPGHQPDSLRRLAMHSTERRSQRQWIWRHTLGNR